MKIRQIADFLGAEVEGDSDIEILRVADLSTATTNEIAFIENESRLKVEPQASCLIVPESTNVNVKCSIIRVKNPKLAFAKVAALLHQPDLPIGWSRTAILGKNADVHADFIGNYVVIGENSKIGKGCVIFDGVRIGRNVKIGHSCIIFPNCVIYDNVTIGDNCMIHAGVIIGADGFGFVRDSDRYVKFPQIGSVIIENDVEIGANSCIDRGALGETRIGEGTKIDNLVHIGHNVNIGKRVVIAAQTGISGSVTIEDDCIIGGQVGIGDHVTIRKGAVIGSQAGVLPGKIVKPGVWWGTPIQPLNEYKRLHAHIKNLEKFKNELKQLRALIEDINLSPKSPVSSEEVEDKK